jgi:hypothetical protein
MTDITVDELLGAVVNAGAAEQDYTPEMLASIDDDADCVARAIIAMAQAVDTINHPEVREAVLNATAKYAAVVIEAASHAAACDVEIAARRMAQFIASK